MATFLNDHELTDLIGTVIKGGEASSVRPNSYILRLGGAGEYMNTDKEFDLGRQKKGIKVPPGHAVALTALETIDFSPETVQAKYPGCALHAIMSPTTDLSREGIVAPTTQVDAGYSGTLNWTITNTSGDERRFLYGERLFRLTIVKLEGGEVPLKFYAGDYQGQTGYVRSQRRGAPSGMRENEWETPHVEGGPESLLDNLIKSGYPWHLLGQKLKEIDQQLKIVSEEYARIDDSLRKLSHDVDGLARQQAPLQKLVSDVDSLTRQYGEVSRSIPRTVATMVKEEAVNMQNRWLLSLASVIGGLAAIVLTVLTNQRVFDFVRLHGSWIGLIVLLVCGVVLILSLRRGPPPGV